MYNDIIGKTILPLPIRTHINAVKTFDDMLRRQVFSAGPSDFTAIDLRFVTATELKTLESSYVLYDASAGVLDDVMAKRVGKFNRQRGFSQAVVGFSVLIAILFIASIGRTISRPLAELKGVTDRISKGDLTNSADIDRHDEIGQLADAINRLGKPYKAAVNEGSRVETKPSVQRRRIRNAMLLTRRTALIHEWTVRGVMAPLAHIIHDDSWRNRIRA